MNKITVSKDELLKKLKENRAAHKDLFDTAIEGYRSELSEVLTDKLELLRTGKTPKPALGVSLPTHNLKEYDTAIGMLEMSVDGKIDLDSNEYKKYVMDDWAWKDNFLSSNSKYLSNDL